jgi:hypothetical protein
MKNFRDFLHVLIGVSLGYLLNLTFNGVPLIARLTLSGIFSAVIGFGWEWFWQMYNHSIVDKKDAYRTIAGCVITILILWFL